VSQPKIQTDSCCARKRLRRACVRVTDHRVCVLEALSSEARPLSHHELLARVSSHRIDRVTLYRVLGVLAEASLIHQVQGTDGVWRFCDHGKSLSGCPGGHPHFMCERCSTMWCLEGDRMPRIEVPEGFVVSHKQMLVLGICPDCHDSKNEPVDGDGMPEAHRLS